MELITRIAPTPSGFLHLGNAYNFYLTAKLAKENRGQLYLRIDDTDRARFRQEYLDDIFETLEWMKISYKGEAIYAGHYNEECRTLISKVPHYHCDCTRSQIEKRTGEAAKYDGHCAAKKLPFKAGSTCTRFAAGGGNPLGDFVIWQKDDIPAYQLSSVVIDQILGVNTIVRGQDLWQSTLAQEQLAGHLNYSFPSGDKLIHHHLLTGENGSKLSKSDNAFAFKNWRKNHTYAELLELFKKL